MRILCKIKIDRSSMRMRCKRFQEEFARGNIRTVSMMIIFKRSHEVTDARGCMRMVKKISMIIMYQRFHMIG